MGVLQRVVKPTTKKGKRALINKAPKLIENVKQTIFIRGNKTSESIVALMKELYMLKKPDAILLNKRHEILPFEDVTPIEKLCQKYDTSMFVFVSHNKKRPNNLVIGRTFDSHLLDAFELGIDSFKGLHDFESLKPSIGIKPCLVFIGEEFESVHTLKRLKNMLIDLFHQKESERIHVNNLEYVLTFVAIENKILLRSYRIKMTNVGQKSPRVDLDVMGPNADLTIRRKILASNDLFKRACMKPKLKGKKIKNIKRDAFGTKLGRVHMTSQNINKLQTRKMKGLKKTASERKKQKKSKLAKSKRTR